MFKENEIVYIPALEKLGYIAHKLENNEYKLKINGELVKFINFLESDLQPIKYTKVQQKKIDAQTQQSAKEILMEHLAVTYIRKNSDKFKQFKQEQKKLDSL